MTEAVSSKAELWRVLLLTVAGRAESCAHHMQLVQDRCALRVLLDSD
jgi:hypothetical protein